MAFKALYILTNSLIHIHALVLMLKHTFQTSVYTELSQASDDSSVLCVTSRVMTYEKIKIF